MLLLSFFVSLRITFKPFSLMYLYNTTRRKKSSPSNFGVLLIIFFKEKKKAKKMTKIIVFPIKKLWSFEINPLLLGLFFFFRQGESAKKCLFAIILNTSENKSYELTYLQFMFTLLQPLFRKSCVKGKAVYIFYTIDESNRFEGK